MGSRKKTIVVALGGNAIVREGQGGTISEQFHNTTNALQGVLELIKKGHRVIITHGNGPIIGYSMLRVENSEGLAPYLPLEICVADTQGGIGFMIALCLKNLLRREKIEKEVAALVTQVIVDSNDPSFNHPTKPVGPFYTEERAKELISKKKWAMAEDAGRGWRRVVPSPFPLDIIEKEAIKGLVKKGVIVIAAGGGGVPIKVDETDRDVFKGAAAVVDKDLVSYVLARDVKADTLMILTNVDRVAVNFRKANEKFLGKTRLEDIKKYIGEGHFPPGSMGPKIEAARLFLEGGGKEVIICALEKAAEAFEGKSGTRITR